MWFNNKRLSVNTNKTACMTLGTLRNMNKLSDEEKSAGLALDHTKLEQVVSCPYLGVHVDQHLKWDGHILNLCTKISQKLAVLCRLRKVLSKRMLCQQYLLCIQPCIDYAISVWGSCSQQNKALIARLHHRAARNVTGNFDFINVRGADLLTELGWQSLNLRRYYYTATVIYKCINEMAQRPSLTQLLRLQMFTHIPPELSSMVM